jgi:RNA 2',3'-cyclic 3'-phosphodiesterase
MRLFVAIDLPETFKADLESLRAPVPTARWVRPEQMHLTLFFIGETPQADAVKAALADIQATPFNLTLAGVGRFPERAQQPPRVLWVGIELVPELRHLHTQVTDTLVKLGFEADARPFSPHITLARLKTQACLREVDAFLETHQDYRSQAFPARAFTLFASTLTPEGAQYQQLAVYPIRNFG